MIKYILSCSLGLAFGVFLHTALTQDIPKPSRKYSIKFNEKDAAHKKVKEIKKRLGSNSKKMVLVQEKHTKPVASPLQVTKKLDLPGTKSSSSSSKKQNSKRQQVYTGSSSFKITNRKGSDVADQNSVDSDMIHIKLLHNNETSKVIKYRYKYIVQKKEPNKSTWTFVEFKEFHKELYFYRKKENQWIRVQVEFDNGSSLEKTVCLKGGTLTSPPDDPIDPWEYTQKLGVGFDVSWFRPDFYTIDQIVAVKAAGFGHIRLRYGGKIYDPEIRDYQLLHEQIELILRHGLIPVLGHCERPDTAPAWWEKVSERYKNYSHKLAFNIFVELSHVKVDDVNRAFKTITADIRSKNKERLVIYCPPGAFNAPKMLNDIVIPDKSDKYYFTEWHDYAGGLANIWSQSVWTTGTDKEKARVDNDIAFAVDWTKKTKRPTWVGAWMQNSYCNIVYISEVVNFTEYFMAQLEKHKIPHALNALPALFWDLDKSAWRTDKLPALEVLNGKASIDPNDSDGDGLSNSDEINKYKTNPERADTDNDNMIDGAEVKYGFNPNDPSDGEPSGKDENAPINDADGDGMSNAKEIHYGFDPRDPADGLLDRDGDGLNNRDEILAKLEPSIPFSDHIRFKFRDPLADHDFDGYASIEELKLGRNPRHKERERNNLPTPADDKATTAPKTPVTIDVLANDTDKDNDTLRVVEVMPRHRSLPDNSSWQRGTVVVNKDNTITYTPSDRHKKGKDTFIYMVTDGKGYKDAMVTIMVK